MHSSARHMAGGTTNMASTNMLPSAREARALPLKHLLETYTSSHPLRSPSPLPPSSRVDPKLTQRLPPPTSASPLLWTLPTWWIFLRFLALKGFHIIWALVCHFLFGPKRRSWGYRMTFITSLMRNIADHSSLADIVLIRRLISLHFLLPLPADAVVTPITFTVPRRKDEDVSRGFLRELDLREDGTRELSGEWVVGTGVWKRLKAERRARQRKRRSSSNINRPVASDAFGAPAGGTPDIDLDSEGSTDNALPERVIYYVHGGAYYVGNAATHRLVTIGVSKACNARVFAITYRLAPEHAFPLPLHDVLAGYLRLLVPPLSIPPENIIIAGDSAGGGLSLALCMYLRDEGYKLPAGLVLLSPWVDLTMSCGSWDENADSDVVPRPEADDHLNPVGCYLGPQGIAKYLTHPYASPLFGNFHGLPPMLIQSGDSEVLRDENTLLAHKATLAGVHVTHELYEDMVHVFQMFSFVPAAGVAINNVGKWVRTTLPLIEGERDRGLRAGRGEKASKLGLEVEEEMEGQGQARVVSEDGQEIGVPVGQNQILPDEMNAARDQRAREEQQGAFRRGSHTSTRSSLRLDLRGRDWTNGDRIADTEGPTVDRDSLPAPNSDSDSDSDSGSITPTDSRSRTPAPSTPTRLPGLGLELPNPLQIADANDATNVDYATVPAPMPAEEDYRPHTVPRLRRSNTSAPLPTSPPGSPTSSSSSLRSRRRPTYSASAAASAHPSPSTSIHGLPFSIYSNPVSPTPSIRRHPRSPTLSSISSNISSSVSVRQANPTTRARSRSHSDIFELVEGYVEGGAANETVIYAPGGELKCVGILGEEEDEEGLAVGNQVGDDVEF